MKNTDLQVMFSHNTDHWATPKKLYEYFINLGYIDPCPLYCEVDNTNKIYKKQKIYINPPYSKIDEWVKFVKNNAQKNIIIMLIPARTDTKYFHELLELKPSVTFVKGRLRFNDKGVAPFPSILLTFNNYILPMYMTFDQKRL